MSVIACQRCGGTLTDSHFDGCWCTPRGREIIEGRSAVEARWWQCTSCGGTLMARGQICRCGRAKRGESKRLKPNAYQAHIDWDPSDTRMTGAAAMRVLERRFPVPV